MWESHGQDSFDQLLNLCWENACCTSEDLGGDKHYWVLPPQIGRVLILDSLYSKQHIMEIKGHSMKQIC